MDVTSYLLGKQQGGGGTPALQNKSVTITENGITNVMADSGYYGLKKVEVTTNVGGGEADKYFYTNVSSFYSSSQETLVGSKIIKELPDNINISSTITDLSYAFQRFRQLIKAPNINTEKVKYMSYAFDYCNNLKDVPIYDTSSMINMTFMFRYCTSLSDVSLDNILQMCINATSYTETKTLKQLGISNTSVYPVSRIEALPHYQDFINAGWTTGY